MLVAVVAALGTVLAGCDGEARVRSAGAGAMTGPFAACPTPTDAAPADGGLPALRLPCLDRDGGQYPLDRATGRAVVINVWASWCPPCATELPAFQRLAAVAPDTVTVLGVVSEDSRDRAIAAAADLGITFGTVYDRAGQLRRAMGRNALPLTLFVDAAGRLRHVYNGPPLDDATLRELAVAHTGVALP